MVDGNPCRKYNYFMSDKEQIQKSLHAFVLPAYNEIPDVGLYLDQVTKYINSFLADFPGLEVTPSMISNYVKLKMVSKANRKMYSREQIAYFIFIVLAKTVLSMDSIQDIFAIRENVCTVEQGYEYFRKELIGVLHAFYAPSARDPRPDGVREEIRMLYNVVVTIAHKMYLDMYFRIRKMRENEKEG